MNEIGNFMNLPQPYYNSYPDSVRFLIQVVSHSDEFKLLIFLAKYDDRLDSRTLKYSFEELKAMSNHIIIHTAIKMCLNVSLHWNHDDNPMIEQGCDVGINTYIDFYNLMKGIDTLNHLSTWEEMINCDKKLAKQLALTIEIIKDEIEFKYILRYGDIKPEHYYQIRDSLIHTFLVSSASVNASKLLLLLNDSTR